MQTQNVIQRPLSGTQAGSRRGDQPDQCYVLPTPLEDKEALPAVISPAATAIKPIMAAQSRGTSRPATNNVPAPISVAAANRASNQPGRIPNASNQRAVPAKPPEPSTLFAP